MQVINMFEPNQNYSVPAASGATTTIFTAASNPNGLIIYAAMFTVQTTVATACTVQIRTIAGGRPVLAADAPAGAVTQQTIQLGNLPIMIPPGVGLEFVNTVSPLTITCTLSARLL